MALELQVFCRPRLHPGPLYSWPCFFSFGLPALLILGGRPFVCATGHGFVSRGDDLLREDVERLFRDLQAVQFATAHAAQGSHTFNQLVAAQRK